MSVLAARAMADDPQMADDLGGAQGMRERRKVHVIAHSMGARLILQALLPARDAAALVAIAEYHNVVLLSQTFLCSALQDSVGELEQLGALTTIYGDRHDRPLAYAETLEWLRSGTW